MASTLRKCNGRDHDDLIHQIIKLVDGLLPKGEKSVKVVDRKRVGSCRRVKISSVKGERVEIKVTAPGLTLVILFLVEKTEELIGVICEWSGENGFYIDRRC